MGVIDFYIITYVAFLAGGSLGMMSGALVDKPELALVNTSALIFPFMYFAGFYRSGNLPSTFKWIEYTSIFYYLFQAYMKNQYDDLDITDCYVFQDINKKCDPLKSFDITMSVTQSVLMGVGICILLRVLGLIGMFYAVKRKNA